MQSPQQHYDVFVSYRRRPSAILATLLEAKLRERGVQAFVDTRQTDGAGLFPDRLLRAIEASDVLVCLLGDATLESEWVRRELEHAHALGKPMIPLFQEQYTPPATSQITPGVDALLQSDGVHIFDVRNVYIDKAFDELAEMIKRTQRRPRPAASRGRWVIAAAALVFVVVAGLLIWNQSQQRPEGQAAALLSATAEVTADVSPTNAPTQAITATPITAAAEGEILLIVSEFEKLDATTLAPGRVIADELRDAVDTLAGEANTLPVRIEYVPEVITSEEQAQALGDQYQATLVIWGNVHTGGMRTRYKTSERWGKRIADCPEKSQLTAESDDEVPVEISEAVDQKYVAYFLIGQLLATDEEHYEQALTFLEEATRIVNADQAKEMALARTYFNIGYVQTKLNNPQQAIEAYSQALEIDPDVPYAGELYDNRATVYRSQGEFQKAIADYLAAREKGYTYHCQNRYLIWSYEGIEDYDSALALANDWVNQNPDSIDPYHDRANIYRKMGDHEAALADYNLVIANNPDNAAAYRARADFYREMQNYDRAIDDYTRAIELDPDHAGTYRLRSWSYSGRKQEGDLERALADMTQAIEHDFEPLHWVYTERGNIYREMQSYDRAIDDYTQAIQLDPNYASAYRLRSYAYSGRKQEGDLERALEDMNEAIRLHYSPIQWAYIDRGNVYRQMKEYEKALDDYNQAIEIDPEYSAAHYYLGEIYYEVGEYDKALAHYQRHAAIQGDKTSDYVRNRITELETATPASA